MRSILFLSWFFFAFVSLGENQVNKPIRKLTFSSGYVERFYNSNEGLVHAPISIIDGYGALFDFSTSHFNKYWWSRSLTALFEVPISYWLSLSVFVPYHEFGHARAAYATGLDYKYSTYGYGGLLRSNIKSYWELSLWRLVTLPFGFFGQNQAETLYLGIPYDINKKLINSWGRDGLKLIRYASGLNNQSFLAKRIAEKIYIDDGHITQLFHYIINKLSTFSYSIDDNVVKSRSDIQAILSSYEAKNYDIYRSDLKLQSLLSFFSGTSFALFRGYYNYIANNNTVVKPAEIFGVRIPDINSYINAQGLSFEIVSGYRFFKDLYLGLAYEFIWKGESKLQVTPSFNYNLAHLWPQLNELWLKGDTVISNGLGGSLKAQWSPFDYKSGNFWHSFSYFLDSTLYNALSLYGERNIPSLKGGRIITGEVFGGVHLRY